MSPAAFKHSLNRKTPPAGLSAALQALWWAASDWDKAHRIVMNGHDQDCAWVQLTCIVLRTISIMPAIGIVRRAANQPPRRSRRNGTRSLLRCCRAARASEGRSLGDGEARGAHDFAPTHHFVVDEGLQHIRRRTRLRRQA